MRMGILGMMMLMMMAVHAFVYYFYQSILRCTNCICAAWNGLIEVKTIVLTDGNVDADWDADDDGST